MPEASTPSQCSDLDKFVDNLDELQLPDLAGKIERMSIFDATSTRAAPELVGSDSKKFEEATRFESLFDLEEDLDRLLKLEDEGGLGDKGATAYRTNKMRIMLFTNIS
jgi:hypothetical protein